MITQSINIAFTTTSSVQFAAPVKQATILDSTNFSFLRQVMISNDGVKIIRGQYAIQFPMNQLFAAAFAALPSMSWAPVVSADVTSSQNLTTPVTASITFGVTDEFGSDITYQWYVSSSLTGGNFVVPTGSATSSYQGTSSANLSASFIGAASGSTYLFYCAATNPAGTTSSSISIVNLS